MKTFQLNQNLNNSRTVSHKLFCSLLVLFFTFLSVLFLGISPATVNLLIKKKRDFSLYIKISQSRIQVKMIIAILFLKCPLVCDMDASDHEAYFAKKCDKNTYIRDS